MSSEVTRRETALFQPIINSKDPADAFPSEIVFHIFSYLNLMSLAVCRNVSKKWNVLASTPFVWKTCKDNDIELKLGLGGMLDKINLIKETIINRRLMKDGFKQPGIPQVRGILLYGAPGTGKSSLTHKIQEFFAHPDFYCLKVSVIPCPTSRNPTFFIPWEDNAILEIRRCFVEARQAWEKLKDQSPLYLIIIDKINFIFDITAGNCEWRENNVSKILREMDNTHQRDNVLVIATTNRQLEELDPIALRPGRFELQIKLDVPDTSARTKILEIYLCKSLENDNLCRGVDLSKVVEMTNGFTGEDIKRLVTNTLEANLKRISNSR